MVCPVCTTTNAGEPLYCSTCNWYFPLKDTPQYHFELGKAKQNYQMVSSFQQMFQHMQIQSKMLEKMSFRLDGLENELTGLKKNKPTSKVIDKLGQYTYPPLTSSLKAEEFDTPEKRRDWWNSLEEQWQKAFKLAIIQKSRFHELTDEDYQYILDTEIARFVGPRGMHPNIDFELTNLSGIQHLTKLTVLVASHNALTSLVGIEHLINLASLFVNSNKLTDIKPVYYLSQVKKLYLNVNQITNLRPVEKLTELETLYCNYNQLVSLVGITPAHSEKLELTCLPNDKLKILEIKRIEEMNIACKKG